LQVFDRLVVFLPVLLWFLAFVRHKAIKMQSSAISPIAAQDGFRVRPMDTRRKKTRQIKRSEPGGALWQAVRLNFGPALVTLPEAATA